MSNVDTEVNEKVTVSVGLIETLLQKEYQRGVNDGEVSGARSVTSLSMKDDCGTDSAVHIIHAKTRRELSREIKSRNYHRGGDNPGCAFMWTCTLLRAYRNMDGTWQGVCVSSVHYDV